ncbi:hypothetical protein Tco_0755856 [Tanacetum coccineum]|uniref:Uncharacterized protein n=1 Tax=Tanacetum coccineum TaxID=301880 RepID=A0ABQ5EFY6_9ASTR
MAGGRTVKEMTTNFEKLDKFENVESVKELWDSLESKCMAEDASSKKFLASNFNNYKMVNSRPIMEQLNELLRILGQYTLHGLKMDESICVSSVIDKLSPSLKDFKHSLKHGKDDLYLVRLSSHLRIVKSLRALMLLRGGLIPVSQLMYDHSNDVPSKTLKPRRSKRARKAKSYGYDFQLYLVKGSRNQFGSQYSYCYSIVEDPRTYNEAMQSRDVAF